MTCRSQSNRVIVSFKDAMRRFNEQSRDKYSFARDTFFVRKKEKQRKNTNWSADTASHPQKRNAIFILVRGKCVEMFPTVLAMFHCCVHRCVFLLFFRCVVYIGFRNKQDAGSKIEWSCSKFTKSIRIHKFVKFRSWYVAAMRIACSVVKTKDEIKNIRWTLCTFSSLSCPSISSSLLLFPFLYSQREK